MYRFIVQIALEIPIFWVHYHFYAFIDFEITKLSLLSHDLGMVSKSAESRSCPGIERLKWFSVHQEAGSGGGGKEKKGERPYMRFWYEILIHLNVINTFYLHVFESKCLILWTFDFLFSVAAMVTDPDHFILYFSWETTQKESLKVFSQEARFIF